MVLDDIDYFEEALSDVYEVIQTYINRNGFRIFKGILTAGMSIVISCS